MAEINILHSHNTKSHSRKWLTSVLLIVAIISLVAALFFGFKYSTAKKQLTALQQTQNKDGHSSESDVQQVVAKVGALIILPTDEEPTLATVSDLAKLKDQPFFANAQLGDKVLIYTKARKAILYRPSSNKIIELAPLTDNVANNPAAAQTQIPR